MSRTQRRFPTFELVGLVLWGAAYAFQPHWAPLFGAAAKSIAATLACLAAVCGCVLGGWCETRLFTLTQHVRPAHRVGLLIVIPAAAVWLIAGPALLFDSALAAHGYDASPALVALVMSAWYLAASLGSLLFFVLEISTSAVLQSFRERTRVLVVSLIAFSCTATIWAAPRFVALLHVTADSGSLSDWQGVALNRALGPRLAETPALNLLLGVHTPHLFMRLALLLICALPAVLSATRKFIDLVMSRIDPIIVALDAVAGGERAVLVQTGGTQEFDRLGLHFNDMVARLAMAERMERAFGMYVSSHVLDRIRAQHGEAQLPAGLRDATVFFADIRGFTAMSERLAPEHVVGILNLFFARAVEVIDAHEGFLNKFVGDALMVVFNGPIDQGDHAERAVKCAVALQEAVAKLNADRAFTHVESIEVGIGIASGPMICGNVGGPRQMEYTVIGDVVNTASRLCGQAAGGEVYVTRRTAESLPTTMPTRAMPPLVVKGKAAPVEVACAWPVATELPVVAVIAELKEEELARHLH